MLESVQDHQQFTTVETVQQRLAGQPRRVVRQPQGLHDRAVDELRIAYRLQLHVSHAVAGRAPRGRARRQP